MTVYHKGSFYACFTLESAIRNACPSVVKLLPSSHVAIFSRGSFLIEKKIIKPMASGRKTAQMSHEKLAPSAHKKLIALKKRHAIKGQTQRSLAARSATFFKVLLLFIGFDCFVLNPVFESLIVY